MADEVPETPKVIPVEVPGVGRVVLVDREKLRRKTDRRFFRHPIPRMGLMAAATPPEPPATTDVSKGEAIKYPILGNDQEGDCYYAAILHMVQSFVGQYGVEPNWNVSDVLRRYQQLSGGDNGLSDDDVYPEWKKGILGPNGPHKIIDSMLVSPTDDHAVNMAIWRFCGVLLTVSLPAGWADNARPGATWDADGTRSVGGHAIILTGKNSKGGRDLRTWGISPPINVTSRGIAANDPEIIVVFSVEQYDPVTHLSSAGFTWEEDRALWITYGGHDVGPAPWGPTPIPNPPTPEPPVTHPVVVIPDKTDYALGFIPVHRAGGTYPVTEAVGTSVHDAVWQDVVKLVAQLAMDVASSNWTAVLPDILAIITALHVFGVLPRAVSGNPCAELRVPWFTLVMDFVALGRAVYAKDVPGVIVALEKIAADLGLNIG